MDTNWHESEWTSIEIDRKLNIDAQDAQDNEHGRLLRERLTPANIACGFADAQEC